MNDESPDTPVDGSRRPRLWRARLRRLLTEPNRAADEQARSDARLLASLLVLLVPLYVLMSAASGSVRVQPVDALDVVIGLFLLSASVGAYVLARLGRPRRAVTLLVVTDLLGSALIALREQDPMRAVASGGFGLLAVLYASYLASPAFTLAALVVHLAATALLGSLHPRLGFGPMVLPFAQSLLAGCLVVVSTAVRARERRRLERKRRLLAEREGHLRALLDASLDAIVGGDGEGKVREWNGQAAATFAWSRAEVLGQPLVEMLFSPESRPRAQALLAAGAGRAELVARCKHGRPLPVEVSVAPLASPERSVAVVVRDLSHSKRLQADLIQSDRLVSVGRLAQGVAHEINNPLTAVLSNLEYVEDVLLRAREGERPGADVGEVVEDMRRALRDVQGIVRDLRSLARGQDDVRRPLEVERVLETAVQMAWNEVRHRARLVRDYQPLPAVMANEARLVQVFLNLLMNAAQAIPAGGAQEHAIVLTTGVEADGRVRVQVDDTGEGIAQAALERIFTPFFTTRPVGEGTGLGLYVCRNIVQGLGGEIRVESEEGKGTRVQVLLPAATHLVAEPASVPPPSRDQAGGSGSAPATEPPMRLLVVEDDATVLQALARYLRHHHVRTAAHGREALAACEEEAFDLVLSDVMMPQMTGVELVETLAQRGYGPERVVLMTGGAFTEREQRWIEQHPGRVLDKPLDLRRLDQLLLAAASARPARVTAA